MAEIQIENLRVNPRSAIKFLMTEKSKSYKIYRRMCEVDGEACFSKINSSIKKKFPGVAVRKEGHADWLQGPKKTHH